MSAGKIIVCVLTAAVLLIWFLWAAFPTVFAAAEGAEATEAAAETAPAPGDGTAPDNSAAQGSGFRLEWYHYVVVSAIMFAMILFSVFSVKPAGKK